MLKEDGPSFLLVKVSELADDVGKVGVWALNPPRSQSGFKRPPWEGYRDLTQSRARECL